MLAGREAKVGDREALIVEGSIMEIVRTKISTDKALPIFCIVVA